MSWTANTIVKSVDSNPEPATDCLITLYAEGADITCDGDDQISSVQVQVVSEVPTHLAVGDRVTVTANC